MAQQHSVVPPVAPAAAQAAPTPGAMARFFDGDVWYSFKNSPVAIIAALIATLCVVCALFANWIAPHNPLDLATLELMDARLPPAWEDEGKRDALGDMKRCISEEDCSAIADGACHDPDLVIW